MRDYSKVSGQFWTGKTGRALRGNMQAQIVALYLLTSPHSNMIGVFHCPVIYIAHETGSSMEGASKGLQDLIEGGFCTYDEDSETVWVHEMAKFQIGDELASNDKQCKGIQKQYEALSQGVIRKGFFEKYRSAYHLTEATDSAAKPKPLASPLQAPTKPGTGTGTGTGVDAPSPQAAPAPSDAPRGSRLPADWDLPEDWRAWAENERPDLDAETVADSFRDFWVSKPGKDGRKCDWQATWRNWVRSQKAGPASLAGGRSSNAFAGAI